jgi:hypothetical protein
LHWARISAAARVPQVFAPRARAGFLAAAFDGVLMGMLSSFYFSKSIMRADDTLPFCKSISTSTPRNEM